MTLKCKVCQKDNPQILEINRNLKPELADLFTPLTPGFSKITRDVGYTFDFQNTHRQRLIRHLQSKSSNFERLQQFCKDEIKKKNQYKQDLQRVKLEYKKMCEEAMRLKATIANISNRTSSLNDLTHDPFRTPVTGRVPQQRGFVTSTPYNNSEDLTEGNIFTTNQTDSSASFSAAGIPVVSVDSGGEVSKLAHMTSAMFTESSMKNVQTKFDVKVDENVTGSHATSRPFFGGAFPVSQQSTQNKVVSNKDHSHQGNFSTSSAHFASKTPAKKSKLDIMSKTQPLPLKTL
ncbi:hypothetical protein KIN20_009436 [Parelaphostrongylus tenuis]|uniref:Uncharacterized protein n=2 Tax=Parelaphostrongylus tenuis TaxID=148309 RepID=A0AAD5MP26_PARTN|nr:hypothetical protein KIN20_009436 [Parelaphostrongylus tenuis]